jgi:hypothetical protein
MAITETDNAPAAPRRACLWHATGGPLGRKWWRQRSFRSVAASGMRGAEESSKSLEAGVYPFSFDTFRCQAYTWRSCCFRRSCAGCLSWGRKRRMTRKTSPRPAGGEQRLNLARCRAPTFLVWMSRGKRPLWALARSPGFSTRGIGDPIPIPEPLQGRWHAGARHRRHCAPTRAVAPEGAGQWRFGGPAYPGLKPGARCRRPQGALPHPSRREVSLLFSDSCVISKTFS